MWRENPEILPQRRWSICFGILFACFLANFAGNSCLAAPTVTEVEEQNRRAKQAAEERQQRDQQQDVFLQKAAKATGDDSSLPAESPGFHIASLRLEGELVERFPWVQTMLDKYKGRHIGMGGINLIVKRLNNTFIERGYVTTRVFIPEQDLSSGVLRLLLVPGIIRDIHFQEPKTWGTWRTAFPARPGDLLNLRSLEQGLEQMKRVPSQDVDMQLVPGDKPGETNIVIAVKRTKSWKAVLSLDDSGTKGTGRLQASQTLAVDNLFGINDLFNITFNNDTERAGSRLGTRGDSLYYSFPQGDSTFTLSSSRNRYHQTVDSGAQSFVSSGESENLEFRVSRLMHRDQTRKTYLEFSVIKKNSESFIDDTEIEVQRKNTTAARLGLSHKQYFGEAALDALLAFQQGVPWFNAQIEPSALAAGAPTTRYKLWTLDAGVTAPIKLGRTKARFSSNLRIQYTADILYGSEYFSIGNRYTVRGFDGEQTLSASRGWFLRNELSIPLAGGGHQAYAGLDWGAVSGPGAESLSGRTLTGAAVGLRGGMGDIQYDVFAGWPLHKPEGFQTANPTFGFQLIHQI